MYYVDAHTHRAFHRPTAAAVLVIENVRLGVDAVVPDGPFTAGLHPWDIDDQPAVAERLEPLLAHPSCVGIGECGLDTRVAVPMDRQEQVFIDQVLLSEHRRLPMVLHVVRAHDRIVALRRRIAPRQPWVVHGMVRPAATALRLVEAGLYLSFGAALLRADSVAHEALRRTPPERLLLETDDAPVAIDDVYRAAAATLGLPVADLARRVADNARTVFGDAVGWPPATA